MAFNSSSGSNPAGGAGAKTHSFTVVAGSNRIIVAAIQWENDSVATNTAGSATLGGNAASGSTSLIVSGTGGAQHEQLFFWLESAIPAAGAQTCSITISSSAGSVQGVRLQVAQFDGRAQSVPSGSAAAQAASNSVNVTAASGDDIFCAGINNDSGTNNTYGGSFSSTDELWDLADPGSDQRAHGAYKDNVSAGTFTCSWTGGTSRPAISAVAMAVVGGGGGGTTVSATLSDSLSFTDAIRRLFIGGRKPKETLNGSEALDGSAIYGRRLVDSLNFSEGLTGKVTGWFVRKMQDVLTYAENFTVSGTFTPVATSAVRKLIRASKEFIVHALQLITGYGGSAPADGSKPDQSSTDVVKRYE